MALKYLEYIQIGDKQVSLYVIQEASKGDVLYFRVQVHDDQKLEFFLCKDKANSWKIITQSFCEFNIIKLFKPLTSSIEKRMQSQKDYLTLN